jgi:hypothetical protein
MLIVFAIGCPVDDKKPNKGRSDTRKDAGTDSIMKLERKGGNSGIGISTTGRIGWKPSKDVPIVITPKGPRFGFGL